MSTRDKAQPLRRAQSSSGLRSTGAWLLLLLPLGFSLFGCDGESGTFSLEQLLGPKSAFKATVEGTLDGTFAGEAYYRTNADGYLVGIELVHGSDATRGLSIELEPQVLAPRTYEVIPSGLMHVDRPGASRGVVAYYEDGRRSFVAVRGSLTVEAATSSAIRGTFSLEMDSQNEPDQPAQNDLTLAGSFTATPEN